MDGQAITFARNGPIHIAYQTFGVDSPDLLAMSSAMLPIDSMDQEPSLARFYRRLATFSRVIRFDRRGVGLSDPTVPEGPTTLEQWVQDAVSILDAVGSERAVVFAPRDSSLEGILLAATRPDRVSGLILINGVARWARADDYSIGVPQPILDTFINVNMEPDAVSEGFDFLAAAAPSVAQDDSFRAWWVSAGYRGASPSRAREIQRVIHEADVRSALPLVGVPTLVLHRRDDNLARVGHGRFIAEQVPNARFVELPGADNLYWVGDTSEILDEIEEFVTGVRRGPDAELVLAGVLFSDIVESTRRMAELGERAWRELLDRHDVVVRRQIERYRGREVKTTGDGVLATFEGPLAAVTCGRAIRDAAAQLGLTVRVGVHVGQIELRAADIGGIAVHIAARVQAHAQPGQILVTQTVVDIAVGAGLKFRPRGSRVLKGVPGRWQLYSVEG